METSAANRARGEESRQAHLLAQAEKTSKLHTVMLAGILVMLLAIGLQNHLNTEALVQASKNQVRSDEYEERSAYARYKDIMANFAVIDEKLNHLGSRCTTPDAPLDFTLQPVP